MHAIVERTLPGAHFRPLLSARDPDVSTSPAGAA
jgi:hypothetical protein